MVTTPPPSQSSLPVTQATHDETRLFITGFKPGETIYFLSRKYSVSENDIIQSNPGIDINKLPLGYRDSNPPESNS